ncbi:MAG: hypothetical protein AMS20_14190, partial [Gemmatimonas sp. SG8_28]
MKRASGAGTRTSLGGRGPIVGLFRQAAVDRLREPHGQPRRQRRDRRRRLRGVPGEIPRDARRLEGQPSGGREERGDAQRVEIAAGVDRAAGGLLGAHVLRRPPHRPRGRRVAALQRASDAEVGHHRPPRLELEQHVVGLHVAVDHAADVRVRQRPRHLLDDPRDLRGGERAVPPHARAERLAVHERHDVEHEVAALLDRVDLHHVRVGEAGRGPRLTEKPLPDGGVRRQLGREQLDRHRPVERHVAREEHHAHPAAAELAVEGVPSGDGLLEREEFGGRHWQESGVRSQESVFATGSIVSIRAIPESGVRMGRTPVR